MRGLRRYIVALCVAVGAVLSAAAQEGVRIESARFEPDSVLLGDHFDLVMDVFAPEGYTVDFPTITPDFAEGKIELIEDKMLDTLRRADGGYHLRKRWRLTSFEPAEYNIGSLGLLWTDGSQVDTLFATEPLTLQVAMIPVDTAQKTIYDIKQPLPMPVTIEEVVAAGVNVLAIVVAVGAVVALIVFVVLRLRKKKRTTAEKQEPPHVVAIRHLEALHNQKLWQNGKIKEYYTRLTEILREYLAGRYGVGAMEMTTDEIVAAMKDVAVEPKHAANLGALLAESDLVKFAKYTLAEENHEEYYNMVYYFIEESKAVAEAVVTPEKLEIGEVVTTEGGKSDE